MVRARGEQETIGAAEEPDRELDVGAHEPVGFRDRIAQQMLRSGKLPRPDRSRATGLHPVHPDVRAALDAWTKGECGHEELPLPVKQVLVRRLLATVGGITHRNGMETTWRFIRPTDPGLTPDQKWAANLLFTESFWEATGAEAATFEGRPYPTSMRVEGANRLRDFVEEMTELSAKPNPTEGAEHLSRRNHANAAREHLAAVDAIEAKLIERMRQPKYDADKRDITHWFTDAVVHALEAGMRGQAARVKAWEPDALRGVKVITGARQARNREADEDRWVRMAAAVTDEVNGGTKVTAAYAIVAERFAVTPRTVSNAVKRVRKS